MELRHLRYFVAVGEEQNITRAAARLRVSQPPLSRQIRDLEEELGIQLLARAARAVKLTDAGRHFLGEARAVLQRANEAVETTRAVATGMQGEIEVGYAPSLAVDLLPRALQTFQRECPGVRARLHDLTTEELVNGVRDGRLDVALVVRPASAALRGLTFDLLQTYPVRVAVSPRHPLARGRAVNLDQLRSERLIGYTRADYPEYHEWVKTLFDGKLPARMEEHESVSSLIAAVESGRGVALVSQSLACLAGPRLKLRPLRPAPAPMRVGAIYLTDDAPAAARRFVVAAKQAAALTQSVGLPRKT
jgi:DNA-binding transcriptional LysR family regulator